MKKPFTLFILIAIPMIIGTFSFSQIFYNNGALIYTAPSATVQVNGGLENNSSTSNGDIEHNGQPPGGMWITLNSTLPNPGDVTLNNNSTLHGDGTYYVQQDWVNNANFTADNSTVELYGDFQQLITGTVVTTFHNLTLTGTGTGNNRKKTQTLDANIDATGILDINDRELETGTNTMFVLNPSPLSVDNDSLPQGAEGFVSSTGPTGYLHRETNTTSNYVFPVGSSNGVTRYRPVRISPTAATSTYYNVRFINYDADNDLFIRSQNDGVMCQSIDTFYHAIEPNSSAIVPANISIYYLSAADGGIWNGMAHWQTNNNQWNDMGAITQSVSNGYDVNTSSNWQFANAGYPYLLTRLRPAAPTLLCTDLCENTQGIFSVDSASGTSYNWIVTGGTIVSGQGTPSIVVNWGSSNGTVFVVDSTFPQCLSLPDSCNVTAFAAPIAGFDTASGGFFNNPWTFIDTSTGAIVWFWYFGDGDSSALQNPIHNYPQPGTYTVTQIVLNSNGCMDTITSIITVNEGILIPNVFTPDGNGFNDVFYIPNSGVKQYHIEIYDRWGAKMWETTADEIRWDGRTLSGQLLSNGTYYYALKTTLITATGEKDYDVNGFVTLLTEK